MTIQPPETRPFLGLYVIVRDAEKTIQPLLESILFCKGGYAFDELVFVDTGSTDQTKQSIATSFGLKNWEVGPKTIRLVDGRRIYLVFDEFSWIDDFSAAREFAFGWGKAEWRGYLDADDVLPNAHRLKPTIAHIAKSDPNCNAISMKYQYSSDMVQEVTRFVRWDDGWKWQDPIHEYLVRTDGNRRIAKIDDLMVVHSGDATASLERNKRICKSIRDKSLSEGDSRRVGLMDHYIGMYASADGKLDEAIDSLLGAGQALMHTNVGAHSYAEASRIFSQKGNHDEAIKTAALAVASHPETLDGWSTWAVVTAISNNPIRSTYLYDRLKSLLPPPLESVRDRPFIDGVTWSWGALSYLDVGRLADAEDALNRVPMDLRHHPRVHGVFMEAYRRLMTETGFQRFKAYIDFLIWCNEPLKALDVLDMAIPTPFIDSVAVQNMRRWIQNKLPHLKSWEDYKRVYSNVPPEQYHTPDQYIETVKSYGRTKAVREWAKGLPKDGPTIDVLSIGTQDGIIEREVLNSNLRIHIVVCDVAEQAQPKLQKLVDDYPDRVKIHRVTDDHYDWPSDYYFDAIFIFEVIEHLPDEHRSYDALYNRLKSNGTLFMSTPVTDRWIEPMLSDPQKSHPWFQHVRAYSPMSFLKTFWDHGFDGDLLGTDNGMVFLARMGLDNTRADTTKNLSIIVNTSKPFSPLSLGKGHLGGSEEAVVHLSQALRSEGIPVTIFAPQDRSSDDVYSWKGVCWRPLDQFDPKGDHQTVLVWRDPQFAAKLAENNPDRKYQILNWLHDTHYTNR